MIDFDEGIIVVDASTGEELEGTICVDRGSEFTTSSADLQLVIDGEVIGTDGPIGTEGDMCVVVDDVLTCGCVDLNNVSWTQQCGGYHNCWECCFSNGGTVKVRTAIKITIPPPPG